MLYTRREFFNDEILLALTLQTTVQGSLSIEVKADNANKVLKRQGSGGTERTEEFQFDILSGRSSTPIGGE